MVPASANRTFGKTPGPGDINGRKAMRRLCEHALDLVLVPVLRCTAARAPHGDAVTTTSHASEAPQESS